MCDIESKLRTITAEHIGEHYRSPTWTSVADALDWPRLWPVVDSSGVLTGDVVDCEDMSGGDWLNVDDLAMVDYDDLPAAERRRITNERRDECCDEYACLPKGGA